jgi:hypothetical protein
MLEAIVSAVTTVEWLAAKSGNVRVAQYTPREELGRDPSAITCRFVAHVWNLRAWRKHAKRLRSRGEAVPTVKVVGHYAIEREIAVDVRPSIRLLLEIPA